MKDYIWVIFEDKYVKYIYKKKKKEIILQDELFRYVAMNGATETSNVLDTRAYFNRCSRLSSLKYSPGVKGPGRIDGPVKACHRVFVIEQRNMFDDRQSLASVLVFFSAH